MQVKKFEAKSMKEALQLVKQELGPEAIILSAKDNKKTFGLAGRGSVEITAAISEKALQKKQYAENSLPDDAKDKFRQQTAKRQRDFIENTLNKYESRRMASATAASARRGHAMPQGAGATARRPPTSQRYIDIGDEDQAKASGEQGINGRRVDDVLAEFAKPGNFVLEDSANQAMKNVNAAKANASAAQDEVNSLRQEVNVLRDLLNQFQVGAQKQISSRHPGADYGLPFELSANFEKLQESGMDTRFIVEILEKANEELSPMEKKKRSLVDAWVARYIMSHTSVTGSWLKPQVGCQAHLFVGPGGHGKTSALVKIASQLVLHEKKKVAVLSCDTFKVGAADQLKIYSQILNLPFETIKHSVEFPKALQKFAGYDAVMVDYPGLTLKDIQEIDHIRSLLPQRDIPKQTHLVLSGVSKDLNAYEACHRYQVTHFDDILITKVDESFAHGFLYNIQRKSEKPLYAFGVGQKIPEDIELATRERVLDLIYKITKNNK